MCKRALINSTLRCKIPHRWIPRLGSSGIIIDFHFFITETHRILCCHLYIADKGIMSSMFSREFYKWMTLAYAWSPFPPFLHTIISFFFFFFPTFPAVEVSEAVCHQWRCCLPMKGNSRKIGSTLISSQFSLPSFFSGISWRDVHRPHLAHLW